MDFGDFAAGYNAIQNNQMKAQLAQQQKLQQEQNRILAEQSQMMAAAKAAAEEQVRIQQKQFEEQKNELARVRQREENSLAARNVIADARLFLEQLKLKYN